MKNATQSLRRKVLGWFLGGVMVSAAILGVVLSAQADPLRALYDDDATFEKLSGAAQNMLVAIYGQKPTPSGLQATFGETLAPPAPVGLLPGVGRTRSVLPFWETPALLQVVSNVLVNNPAADTTAQDTQSETSLVLGAGSTVVVGFNDSSIFVFPTNLKFTGWSRSTNGGTSFTDQGALPASANEDGGDPVLARDVVSGTIYFTTLTGNLTFIKTFRSNDNGATLIPPVQSSPGSVGFQDKPWMAVDNFSGAGQGNVYLSYRDFGSATPATRGIRFARSTDGGATYAPSPGQLLVSEGTNNVQGSFVTIGPNHHVYVFWLDQSAGVGTANIVRVRRSTDQGVTFGAAVNVATLNTNGINGSLALTSGFRTNSFPQAAVNPVNGDVYVVYNDCSSTPCGTAADHGNIFFRRSTDEGLTWGAAAQVNDDLTTRDQFIPALAVTPDGLHVMVGFYDRRLDAANTAIDRFGAIGDVDLGLSNAVTFRPNERITTANFPPAFGATDPAVNTLYMGDYDQIVADTNYFYTTWGDNRLPHAPFRANQPDVRFSKITACPEPTITSASASPNSLWPPNHKLVRVTVGYGVTDPCANTCSLSVASNEPINGLGDGDTAPDWFLVDAHHVLLRSERSGLGTGRIYTITITCTNTSGGGLSSDTNVTVNVPHDQGP